MLGFLFLSTCCSCCCCQICCCQKPGFFLVIGFVAFVVGFVVVVVRLVLSSTGFFVEVFQMMGVNVMCKGFHFGKCWRLPLLTHNVFDAFGESRIVAVPEDTFIQPVQIARWLNLTLYFTICLISCILRLSIPSSASAVRSTGPN